MGRSTSRFFKYPRTPHLFGSERFDDDKRLGKISSLRLLHHPGLVIEEKVDGANVGIHFSSHGALIIQCRGHELESGAHPQFDLLKSWATARQEELRRLLDTELILFGEWLYAQHQIAYSRLPHYLLEFDVYDKTSRTFLDTARRQCLLRNSPVSSVRIMHRGHIETMEQLYALIDQSAYGEEPVEGLYLKTEEAGIVRHRAKYVRGSFRDAVEQAGEHWSTRPIRANRLIAGADLWT